MAQGTISIHMSELVTEKAIKQIELTTTTCNKYIFFLKKNKKKKRKNQKKKKKKKEHWTWPRMWALECQKVSRPSSLSNVNSFSSQSPSNGLCISHRAPSTLAINALDAKLLEISFATSNGVVFHFFPSFTDPSGNTILTKQNPKK